MPQFEFTGLAVRTALQSGIDSDDTTIVIQDGTGWPTGAEHPFIATIGDKEAGQAIEKILVTARTGTAPATLSGVTRAHEGVAQAWGPNTQIRHTISAAFVAELSAHVHDDTRDDHGQYHNAARHAAVLHTAAMIGPDSVGTDELTDNSVATLNIQDLAVTTAKLAALGVTEPKLANNAVIARVLAAGSIDDHSKFSTDTRPVIAQLTDPGAVVNGVWFDLTARQFKVRNAANTGWEIYGELVQPFADFIPAFPMVVLGTGGHKYGRIGRIGDTVVGIAGFTLGTGGNVTGIIEIDVPDTMDQVGSERFDWIAAGKALDASTGSQFAAVAVVDHNADSTSFTAFATAGATANWDQNTPFDWQASDHFHGFFMYEKV